MARRLACLSIPSFAMQAFLFERPEWAGEAVVLLDRDEANGRILAANRKAAGLGLRRGMMYGPCLGIHRNLRAGVADEGRLADWRERVEGILFDYSPVVERAGFRDGTWWMEASGLSAIFPSVRPWLEEARGAVAGLGLECGAAAGTGRFSTWAAALSDPSAPVRIFANPDTEAAWFDRVPISLFSMKADTRSLTERLGISSMGNLVKIPLPDIRRRLGKELAGMVEAVGRDARLPLQSVDRPLPAEWRFPLEDPVVSAGPLRYAADRLIGRCRERARRLERQVRSIRFIFDSRDSFRELVVRPARPTRDGALLSSLFASRLEYLDLDDPVRGIRCVASFAGAVTPQGTLFGDDSRRRYDDAARALASLQAGRGEGFVQYARIRKDPLPTRCFELREWEGFPRRGSRRSGAEAAAARPAAPVSRKTPAAAAAAIPPKRPGGPVPVISRGESGPWGLSNPPKADGAVVGDILIRRIALNPRPLSGGVKLISRVAYSGGWWDRPYSRELAWGESGGRTCWLSAESGRRPWELIGWLE